MKFNFGTGIVIAMGLFMIFILQYVIRVQFDHSLDNELVTENYYQQEVEIDGKRDREMNALALSQKVEVESDINGIHVHFPKDFDYKQIAGKVLLYRPSEQSKDMSLELKLVDSDFTIPATLLVNGRWDIVIEWSYDNTSYRNEEKLNVHLGDK